MADVLTDRDIDDYVAAAGDVALLFVGTPEDVMLGALYQVRMLQSSTSARGGVEKRSRDLGTNWLAADCPTPGRT